ncbi:MAG: cation diffusion facilitator family transporter [Bacteroidia bacterium]|nr:cation diffusion facilitator family transporter [Bacteroidia bacterium]
MERVYENLKVQKWVVFIALFLFIVKLIAWYLTQSVAVLTDALESTANVISGFIGLYSLYLSALPRDNNHPYGHGKVEFLSAAVEGTLITIAGIIIIIEAISNLNHPHSIGQLDYGMILIGFSALVNYFLGAVAIKRGTKNNSLALVASGKHLQSDTYSTIGILIGLFLIKITHQLWIDSVVAIIFAIFIIYTGVMIIRESISGIMDEADEALLNELVEYLYKNKNENWVDMHNLRVIKYGSILHLDCHLTVPWYLNVHEAHKEVEILDKLVKDKYGSSVELFVHTDGCLDFSCKICPKIHCKERSNEFVKVVHWDIANISTNEKHKLKE